MQKQSLLLVGNGSMGSSFIFQLRSSFNITIVSPNSKPRFDCQYFTCLTQVKSHQDIIIFAVKPYQISSVLKNLNPGCYNEQSKVISLLLGAKTSFFREHLQNKCEIYICMPNLPVKFGKGILAVYGPKKLPFLEALGQVIYTKTEEEIYKFTGITGCGSGFIFHLLSVYEEAAKSFGIDEKVDTKQLVLNLFQGTLEMAVTRMEQGKEISLI